jgi:hypothetical protein
VRSKSRRGLDEIIPNQPVCTGDPDKLLISHARNLMVKSAGAKSNFGRNLALPSTPSPRPSGER